MCSGVDLRLRAALPEKFVERALADGVRIRICRRLDDRHVLLRVRRRDAAHVQQLAERCGLVCDVQQSHGASAWTEALLRRRSVLLGVLCLLLTAALLLSRIWMVQVLPVDDASPDLLEKVQRALAEAGGVPGAAAWSLDRAQLRARIISTVPEAGYVSVKRKGVCLVAEVSGVIDPPATYDIGAVRNIVAMHDGVVRRVDVYAGTAAVEPGATVRRGDVLIYGWERDAGEMMRPVAAEGVVTARIWQTAQVQQPLTEMVLIPTGRRDVAEHLQLPWGCLQMRAGPVYAAEMTETEFLPVGGVFLPVGILRTAHIECREERQNRSEAAVKRLLLEEAATILDENMPFGARVIDKWEDYSMIDSGIIYMKLTRELEADIAAAGRTEN